MLPTLAIDSGGIDTSDMDKSAHALILAGAKGSCAAGEFLLINSKHAMTAYVKSAQILATFKNELEEHKNICGCCRKEEY